VFATAAQRSKSAGPDCEGVARQACILSAVEGIGELAMENDFLVTALGRAGGSEKQNDD
jgi:hypothetical protein